MTQFLFLLRSINICTLQQGTLEVFGFSYAQYVLFLLPEAVNDFVVSPRNNRVTWDFLLRLVREMGRILWVSHAVRNDLAAEVFAGGGIDV